MSPVFLHVTVFELPTAKPSTVEYRYDSRTNMTEVWCTVYQMVDGRRQVADSTFIEQLEWLPMNDCGVLWREEAWRHFIDNYAQRRWSSQPATDTALGYTPNEQWL
jgi:hypothetical protein